MGLGIPLLNIKIPLESSPLKSIILVRRLAVGNMRGSGVQDGLRADPGTTGRIRHGQIRGIACHYDHSIHIHILCMYMCIYIYIERERYICIYIYIERERERYIYIYIYISQRPQVGGLDPAQPTPGSESRWRVRHARAAPLFGKCDHSHLCGKTHHATCHIGTAQSASTGTALPTFFAQVGS